LFPVKKLPQRKGKRDQIMGAPQQETAKAIQWIDENEKLLTEMSDRIWLYAEPPLQEYRASKLLAEELKKAGFSVQLGVAGLDTAFVATYGHGSPVLSTFAEYDAVEGCSQMPVPYKNPVIVGKGGTYDMHHGIGPGSIGAAIAIKHVMEKDNIPGTLKVFGTPAEKNVVGKNIMLREGLFEGLDACIVWHPSIETSADWYQSIQIRCNNYTTHTFEGVSTHTGTPWVGRNALQALELMNIAFQFQKDAIVPISQFPIVASIIEKEFADYGISSVPGIAKATYVSRALTRKDHELIQKKLFDCADAAALAFGVKVKNEATNGTWEGLPNRVLANAVHKNIGRIGPPKFTEKDIEFGRLIQKEIGFEPSDMPFGIMEVPPPPGTRPPFQSMLSNDCTVLCYICPFVRVGVNYLGRFGQPDWSTAALSITNVAHQALLTGAKIVAISLLDLFRDPNLLREAQEEFRDRTKAITFYNPMPEDRPVPKREPLPEEHYRALGEAFKKGSKWEGYEPELSERMEKVVQKVLEELS
jgi:aminobenzoyl-glutamate utilization protein B